MGLEVALRVDSTNQRLIEAASAGDPQALFAEAQSAGRGRRGRDWRSPFGANLYLSLAWSFAGWPPKLGTLPLAIGITAARALAACGLPGVQLKWPNDLRIGDAKLGGILIESRSEIGGSCRVIIGLGLNVAMTAGHVLLEVLSSFVIGSANSGVLWGTVVGLPSFILMIAICALELLVAGIQAYVFALLTSLYLNDAENLH